jgi:hypothetical protein
MIRKGLPVIITMLFIAFALNGCSTSGSSTGGSSATGTTGYAKSFKGYPDHYFNPKEYVKGMSKGGHGLLIWQDPSANLTKYPTITVPEFEGRLLPVDERFSITPFIKNLEEIFNDNLDIKRGTAGQSLRIEGAMVECNPGNRAARYLVGFGAGKAAGAVAVEVYEPGKSSPSIRIYARDTASMGGFGGDSVAFLNNIFNQIAFRVTAVLEERIGN